MSTCEHCGLEYSDFRTGYNYQGVLDMLWSASENPNDWRYKGRSAVLGFWHELKLGLFALHIGYCEQSQASGADSNGFKQSIGYNLSPAMDTACIPY